MADSIGFDPVAWSIDGGRHNGELLRVLAYAATGGAEGIVTPGDCRVHALSTPGPQVNIDPGALLVLNRSAGVRNQTYAANGRGLTALDVQPTTSSGGRSDLVVVRIEDPAYSPWPTPTAAAAPTYQYARPFVIQNVPAGTRSAADLNLGYSALALARLDIPASTATITNAMVVDLREVALPRRKRVQRRLDVAGSVDLTSSSFVTWPPVDIYVDVPSWATRAIVRFDVFNARLETASADGYLRANMADQIFTAQTYYNVQTPGDTRLPPMTAAGELVIPVGLRGARNVKFNMQGRRTNGSGNLTTDPGSTFLLYDVELVEVAS